MSFQDEVISWYQLNKRDLPWRHTTPWGVLVSEFMLQQTPVARVLPVWDAWMKRWPTSSTLAKATPAEVITAWGRLGYPRRALRLHECAKIISTDFDGEVPRAEIDLRALPGIGEYTSAAIIAFAFGESSLVLDVNIRRIFSRVVDGVDFPNLSATNGEKQARSELIPPQRPALWAAGTMELGALVCTARKPLCDQCPVKARCVWRAKNFPESGNVRKTQGWHGTDRQCRGVIVQALRENASLTELELKKLWIESSQLEKALGSLEKDGLISTTKRGEYCLPN
jgi:A/G-specific adenine glycosylase